MCNNHISPLIEIVPGRSLKKIFTQAFTKIKFLIYQNVVISYGICPANKLFLREYIMSWKNKFIKKRIYLVTSSKPFYYTHRTSSFHKTSFQSKNVFLRTEQIFRRTLPVTSRTAWADRKAGVLTNILYRRRSYYSRRSARRVDVSDARVFVGRRPRQSSPILSCTRAAPSSAKLHYPASRPRIVSSFCTFKTCVSRYIQTLNNATADRI